MAEHKMPCAVPCLPAQQQEPIHTHGKHAHGTRHADTDLGTRKGYPKVADNAPDTTRPRYTPEARAIATDTGPTTYLIRALTLLQQ